MDPTADTDRTPAGDRAQGGVAPVSQKVPASLHPPMHPVPTRHGVVHGFLRLAGGYWCEQGCWRAWSLTVSLALLTVALVLLQMRLNLWTADLFDALERRSTDRFLIQVAVFAAIVLGTVATTTAHQWVKRRLQLEWRNWLTARIIGCWMDRAKHYQVAFLPGDHDNPDGRIAEDVRVLTEAAVDLASTLF